MSKVSAMIFRISIGLSFGTSNPDTWRLKLSIRCQLLVDHSELCTNVIFNFSQLILEASAGKKKRRRRKEKIVLRYDQTEYNFKMIFLAGPCGLSHFVCFGLNFVHPPAPDRRLVGGGVTGATSGDKLVRYCCAITEDCRPRISELLCRPLGRPPCEARSRAS